MRGVRFLAATVALASMMVARAEMTSGPQVGERVGAFTVTKVAGNPDDGVDAGKNLCYRCKTGGKPVVMVFARTADEKLAKLVKKVEEEVAETRAPRLVHDEARATAAAASTRPAPNLWWKWRPAGLLVQPVSAEFTFLAERMRISCTSRQPRFGLVWRMRATTPAAVGVAEEVPPKVWV